jgi:tetratricopeptide (TPR) repeat protein
VPIGSVALRVNWLAALCAALGVLFTFLLTVRLIRYTQGQDRTTTDEVLAWTGGICAALFIGFSRTYWFNAIDGEVYAFSSWVQVLILYLGVRWWEGLPRGEGDNRLLVAWYLCFLCIGINLTAFLVTPALALFVFMVHPRTLLSKKNLAWAVVLALAGVSVHLYLLIRAHANPPINEGDPRTWEALRAMIMREQYGSRPMLPRTAPWGFQLRMFLRYFFSQFVLHAGWGWLGAALPVAIGLFGGVMHWMRHKKTFYLQAVTILICSLGLVVYLNFTDHEVRERDYFFTWAYHFFAIWIGMGLVFLIQWARERWPAFGSRYGWAVACAGAIAFSTLPLTHFWYTHDRRGFYVASDYAYNMLAPLERNAILFTNGDNDTFPLWYEQQGEGFRKDVNVINLSLLNTDWYIRQLRDQEPKVPMSVSDGDLSQVREAGYLLDPSTGQPEMVNHAMVLNIVAANQNQRPVYIAVTVPDHNGLDARLVSEGLVLRVEPDGFKGDPRVVSTDRGWMDTTLVRRNLYEVFKYRGLYDESGNLLPHPYKDDNARRLTQNYMVAHMQMAFEAQRTGQFARAMDELRRVSRMSPDVPQATGLLGMFQLESGDSAGAWAYFARMERTAPSADIEYYYGVALGLSGRVDSAVVRLLRAGAMDPSETQAYKAAMALLRNAGREKEAEQVLQMLIEKHPEDPEVQAYLHQADSSGARNWSGQPGGTSGP